MIHYGDVCKINGAEIPKVDCITFGAPCQDLSVAGKRQGMKHSSMGDDETTRSGLFFEAVRIIKEMREDDRRNNHRTNWNVRPRYAVYENVPGAFSSNNGADFQAVLTEIVKIVQPDAPHVPLPDKWGKSGTLMGYGKDGCPFSVSWRVHDAQFWGVPQRRKRIALVADFGGLSAPDILFERKGLRWDSAESGSQREGTPSDAARSTGDADRTGKELRSLTLKIRGGREFDSYGKRAGKGPLIQEEKSATLGVSQDQTLVTFGFEPGAAQRLNTEARFTEETAPTLRANMGDNQVAVCVNGDALVKTFVKQTRPRNSEEAPTIVESDIAPTLNTFDMGESRTSVYCLQGNGIDRADTAGCNGRGWCKDVSYTLNTIDRPAVFDARGNGNGGVCPTITGGHQSSISDYTAICIGNGQPNQIQVQDKVGALNCMHDQQAVMTYGIDRAAFNQGQNAKYDISITEEMSATCVAKGPNAVFHSVVRRLTPMECERLQGYPDGWTDIGDWVDSKGKERKTSDSARYKALGNSIALPYWKVLARRICAQYDRDVTMGSLFDGICGFPVAFSRCGAIPVWSSEIEEFCIAVAKKRFPDKDIPRTNRDRFVELFGQEGYANLMNPEWWDEVCKEE